MKIPLFSTLVCAALIGASTASAQLAISTFGFGSSIGDDGHEYHYITYDGPSIPAASGFQAATTITTQEAGVDAVFSQAPAFTGDPVDITYLTPTTVTGITNIANLADWTAVTNNPAPGPFVAGATINMWFVDTIDYCGGTTDPSIIGCAGGLLNVVEAAFAALPAIPGNGGGVELIAHELGHNLGLPHVGAASPATNLMNPAINGNTILDAGQATTVQAATQINGTTPNKFVNVLPISINPIPEPSSVAFLSIAGLLLIGRRRR